jgi:peptidoglycan/LPS O-acetylase OafA/YrhL
MRERRRTLRPPRCPPARRGLTCTQPLMHLMDLSHLTHSAMPPDAPIGPQGPSRLHWLDLLRFLAAFAVVVVHARGHALVEFGSLPPEQRTNAVFALFALTRVGSEAVTIFFVLSGFLVGGKALERIVAGRFRLADYAIDRISRIYVPLVPALCLSALVAGFIPADRSPLSFLGNLVGLSGIAVEPFGLNRPLWSLSYEIWFYVLAGAIGIAASVRGLHLRAACAIILVASLFTVLSPTYLFCWVIGALAYWRRPARPSIALWVTAFVLMAYGTLGVEIGMVSDSVKGLGIARFVPSWDISHILLSTGTAILIQQLILWEPKRGWVAWVERVGTPLGAFSYTMYLVHYPIIRYLVTRGHVRQPQIDGDSVGSMLLMIAASLLGSVVMYLLFERHTAAVRRFLKSLWARRGGRDAMDAST